MDEFKQWVIFESLFIIAAATIWLFAAGKINSPRTQSESFKDWQKRNGGVVRMMCILVIVVALGILAYKYFQIQQAVNAPPSLQTD